MYTQPRELINYKYLAIPNFKGKKATQHLNPLWCLFTWNPTTTPRMNIPLPLFTCVVGSVNISIWIYTYMYSTHPDFVYISPTDIGSSRHVAHWYCSLYIQYMYIYIHACIVNVHVHCNMYTMYIKSSLHVLNCVRVHAEVQYVFMLLFLYQVWEIPSMCIQYM